MAFWDNWGNSADKLTTEQLIEKVVAKTVTNSTSAEQASALRQRIASTISGGNAGDDTLHNIFYIL